MLYLYMGIAVSVLAVLLVTNVGNGQIYLLYGIVGFSAGLIVMVANGLQRIAIPLSIFGYWLAVSGLMFVTRFYHYFEVYKLTTLYLFILFLGEMVIHKRVLNIALIGISICAIWLQYYLRADDVLVTTGRQPDLDDVVICSALMLLASYIVNQMIARGARLLRSVRDEAKEKSERAAELKALRNHLEDIINAMSSVLISVDASGLVVQWNRKALEIVGISAEEAEGRTIYELLPQIVPYREKIQEAINTGKSLERLNEAVKTADGSTRYQHITVFPMQNAATPGAVIRIDDVTEQYQMQEILIQSEKMLSVGGLAAGMAHEINNPLGGILNAVSTIENRLRIELPANQEEASELALDLEKMNAYLEKRKIIHLLELIRRSGLRAAEIVRNMLSFSRRSDEGKVNVNLVKLANDCLELAATDFDLKKNYDFRRIQTEVICKGSPPMVKCDPVKIQQVILNILRNGAEAMHEAINAGTMNRSPRICLTITKQIGPEGEQVALRITDNGPGMDESVRKRVFEPFFTTKPVGKGTGLGLSVSYFIVVDNHHGEMHVESVRGEGTSFVVRLPL